MSVRTPTPEMIAAVTHAVAATVDAQRAATRRMVA
jgi:hypothetical protein